MSCWRYGICALAVVTLLVLASPCEAVNLSQANAFLTGAQSTTGLWGDLESTAARDTATALDTLALLGYAQGEVHARGLAGLSQLSARNTDELARGISAAAGVDAVSGARVTRVLDAQDTEIASPTQPNFPGRGWGLGRGFATSALDTALALRVLKVAGFAGGVSVVRGQVAVGQSSLPHPFEFPAGATGLIVFVRATTGPIKVLMHQPGGGTFFVDLTPAGVPTRVAFPNTAGPWGLQVQNTGGSTVTYTLEVGFTRGDGFDVFRFTTPLVYLGLTQNSDGGWGVAAGEDSHVMVSAEVLMTLRECNEFASSSVLPNGVNWLVSKQNGDGGFGSEPGASTVYETALAGTAIALASPGHGSLSGAAAFLTGAQLPNGSWNDDPYQTALAMRALLATTPLPAPAIITNGGSGPGGDFVTDLASITLRGTAPLGTVALLSNLPSAVITLDPLTGEFTVTLPLAEGLNNLTFTPVNGFGQPGAGTSVDVTRNSSLVGQELDLGPGLSLIGLTVDPLNISTAAQLLDLVGPRALEVQRLDADTGQIISLARDGSGGFVGTNFSLDELDGLHLTVSGATSARVVGLPPSATTVDLVAGTNVLTIPNPPPDLTAFGLLGMIGNDSVVSALQRIDTVSGRFETAAYSGGITGGTDFPIEGGLAYLVHLHADRPGFLLPVGIVVTVEITSPADGSVVTNSPVTVTGTVTGEEPVAVMVNGTPASVSGGTFTAGVPLTPGSNTITAAATDNGGRTGNDVISVTFEPVDFSIPRGGSATGSRVFTGPQAVLDQAAFFTEARTGLPAGVTYQTTGVTRISATEIRVNFMIGVTVGAVPGIFQFQVEYGLLNGSMNPLGPLSGNVFIFRIEITP